MTKTDGFKKGGGGSRYAKKGFTKSSTPRTRWGRKIKPIVYIYDSSNLKPGSAVELCSNEKAWVFNSTVLLMKKQIFLQTL